MLTWGLGKNAQKIIPTTGTSRHRDDKFLIALPSVTLFAVKSVDFPYSLHVPELFSESEVLRHVRVLTCVWHVDKTLKGL